MDDLNKKFENEAFKQYSQFDDGFEDGYDDDYYGERLEYIIDEIEDIKSALTEIKKAKTEQGVNSEIERLRAELLKTQNAQTMYFEIEKVKNDLSKENKIKEEQLNREIASLRRALRSSDDGSAGIIPSEIINEIGKINDRLDNLAGAATGLASAVDADLIIKIDALTVDITAIKEQLSGIEFAPVDELPQSTEAAVAEDVAEIVEYDLIAELAAIKESLANNVLIENEIAAEINSLKQKLSDFAESKAVNQEENEEISEESEEETETLSVSDDQILSEIISLREEISAFKTEMNMEENVYQASNNVDILNEILLLREDLSVLQDAPKAQTQKTEGVDVDDLLYEQDQIDRHSVILGELNKIKENFGDVALIREEVQALKADIAAKSTIVSASGEVDNTAVFALTGLIASLKEEITDLKSQLATKQDQPQDNLAVINELRELTVAMKAEINILKRDMASYFEKDSDTAAEDSLIILDELSVIQKDIKSIKDEPDAAVLNEVLSLRESFQTMKDDLKLVDNTAEIMGGINMLKESLDEGVKVTEFSGLMEEIGYVRSDVAALANGGAMTETILSELESLKADISAKQETEKASMLFLNELTNSKLIAEKPAAAPVAAEKELTATLDSEVSGLSELRNELAELAAMISSQKIIDDSEKRGRGRPKKEASETDEAEDGEKRGRGRPKKVLTEEELEAQASAVKRGRGRPKKETAEAEDSSTETEETLA